MSKRLVVDFIKCDVEGGELPVLRGATQLLQRDHPDLLLEIGIIKAAPKVEDLFDASYIK